MPVGSCPWLRRADLSPVVNWIGCVPVVSWYGQLGNVACHVVGRTHKG